MDMEQLTEAIVAGVIRHRSELEEAGIDLDDGLMSDLVDSLVHEARQRGLDESLVVDLKRAALGPAAERLAEESGRLDRQAAFRPWFESNRGKAAAA